MTWLKASSNVKLDYLKEVFAIMYDTIDYLGTQKAIELESDIKRLKNLITMLDITDNDKLKYILEFADLFYKLDGHKIIDTVEVRYL